MYLQKHTTGSPSRARRSPTVPPDTQSLNSGQTAALIVFGVLLGLIVTGVMIWCCCCRGPGWQRKSSSRSKVKIIRRSAPRSESESPESSATTEVSSLPSLPVFVPLPPAAAPVPIRPLGPRGMLPGALSGLNEGEVANESNRNSSGDRCNQASSMYQHQRPQSHIQPAIPPTRYALPPLLQGFAQPQTPIPPPVPIPQGPQSQQPSQPQTRAPPLQIEPLRITPPSVYYARHHYPQDRVPITKLINDHTTGITRPLPLSLPIGRHGMVNLALKYQVHGEKGSETPRMMEKGYRRAYCESSAESDEGHDAYESMENFGTGNAMTYERGRGPRWG